MAKNPYYLPNYCNIQNLYLHRNISIALVLVGWEGEGCSKKRIVLIKSTQMKIGQIMMDADAVLQQYRYQLFWHI